MLVNGVNLNVKVVGSGPPVVALHGFAGNSSTWKELVQEARKKYTVITIDLLGHGDSDSPSDPERYRVENAVNDIAVTLDKLGFSRACWLGYSMGGRIALVAAALMPDVCCSLVLEGASPGLISPSARARRQRNDEALANLLLKEGIEAFTDRWEQRSLFRSQKSLPHTTQERIRNQRLTSSPIGLANTLRAAGPGVQPVVQDLLPDLKMPVLCIAGEYDHKFTAIARKMCGKLRYGRLAIIRGAGHATHLEKPGAFNRVVLKFIDSSLE